MSIALSDLASPISDFAIIVNSLDNVAVVKKETSPGLEVELPDGRNGVVNVQPEFSAGESGLEAAAGK